jgi:hypothetical protein
MGMMTSMKRENRGPDKTGMGMKKMSSSMTSNAMGMGMMTGGMHSMSLMRPNIMNMDQIDTNSTNTSDQPSKMMSTLEHSDRSPVEGNNSAVLLNQTERNSTVGKLLERIKKGQIEEAQYESHSTTFHVNNNTQPFQNETGRKHSRLHDFWNKLVEGLNFNNDSNKTVVGTKLWSWFHPEE